MISPTMQHLLLLLILTTVHNFIHANSETCNLDDKKALLQIKKQFGNPTQLSSWDPTTDCCNNTWLGVNCDISYRVSILDLFDLNLPKLVPFPPSITNLPSLVILSFTRIPNLVGPIPLSIANLTTLRYVTITQTNISGEIPYTLSQIKTLVTIEFNYNKLTGPLLATLSTIPSLVGIGFNGNQLTGTIPESYGSFPALFTGLLLSRNRLSGKVPVSLGKLNLADLDLSRNMLEGDVSMFFKSNISTHTISLAMNSFAFDIGKVGLSKDLNKLDIRNNKIYVALLMYFYQKERG
ncbi:hypothetical protein TSUD_84060 [Trifolium subterraneum]|uniref:Leucine-rich repeat-containing N-terminal plant-type domain-containing protein n=1 Tax=Trifolium subterraneum TaxID=3900 RepID=A0A2Z6MKZ0_TRISU|nr:hypothetical protein TSUD_84060 [Trifolium subterraneum]